VSVSEIKISKGLIVFTCIIILAVIMCMMLALGALCYIYTYNIAILLFTMAFVIGIAGIETELVKMYIKYVKESTIMRKKRYFNIKE